MRRLEPVVGDHTTLLSKTVSNKQEPRRQILRQTENKILALYNDYKLFTGNLFNLLSPGGLGQPEQEALVHCYTSPVSPFRELKMKIREQQHVQECQYCCVNRAKTLDHYLPKENFPEFAILTLNLIPCCSDCNNVKGSRYKDKWNNRLFINLFYEDEAVFNKCRFLNAVIDYEADVPIPTYFIDDNGELPDSQFGVIKNHFRELNLLQIYREQSNAKIYRIRESMMSLYSRIPAIDIPEELHIQAEIIRAQSGLNYWEAALNDALACSEQFVKSCKGEGP